MNLRGLRNNKLKIKNKLKPITFEPKKRKRRQEITDINETGSYYITRKETFLKSLDAFLENLVMRI